MRTFFKCSTETLFLLFAKEFSRFQNGTFVTIKTYSQWSDCKSVPITKIAGAACVWSSFIVPSLILAMYTRPFLLTNAHPSKRKLVPSFFLHLYYSHCWSITDLKDINTKKWNIFFLDEFTLTVISWFLLTKLSIFQTKKNIKLFISFCKVTFQ